MRIVMGLSLLGMLGMLGIVGALGCSAAPRGEPETERAASSASELRRVVDRGARLGVAERHACVVKANGRVACWGDGEGWANGTGHWSVNQPLEALGPTQMVAVDAHGQGTIAVKSDGSLWRWGRTLINNGMTYSPEQVPGLGNVVQASIGGVTFARHWCAVRVDGTVWCAGNNSNGQLGTDTTGSTDEPVQVENINDAIQVSTGSQSSCALRASGTVKCWGRYSVSPARTSWRAESINALSGVTSISQGTNMTCAVLANGRARCFGTNYYGQLGCGTCGEASYENPSYVGGTSPLEGIVQLDASNSYACAVTHAGRVYCWGSNTQGNLGDGSYTDQNRPVPTGDVGKAVAVKTGDSGSKQACALTADGDVYCWGSTPWPGGVHRDPTLIGGHATSNGGGKVVAGVQHTCALSGSGRVKCWGHNSEGQLGDNTRVSSSSPVSVALDDVVDIAAGGFHTCALTGAGAVYCWGSNNYGQVGTPSTPGATYEVAPILSQSGFRAIAGGRLHTCGIRSNGRVKCWGSDANGQLGNGGVSGGDVSGFSDVVALAAGATGHHSCGINGAGAARCWGLNDAGQLGNGNTTDSEVAVLVAGGWLWDLVSIAVGEGHTCAVMRGGSVKCWGQGTYGQLGDGLWTSSTGIRTVSNVTDAVDVVAGGLFTCARRVNGRLECWGAGGSGQIGNGSSSSSPIPEAVSGITTAIEIAAGSSHACAYRADGTARCWGSNGQGQLGFTGSNSNTPVSVSSFP
jgi:alpha-tubulin suppressor-like RCC1 family protein